MLFLYAGLIPSRQLLLAKSGQSYFFVNHHFIDLFYSRLDVPISMAGYVDMPHAVGDDVLHFISIQDHITRLPNQKRLQLPILFLSHLQGSEFRFFIRFAQNRSGISWIRWRCIIGNFLCLWFRPFIICFSEKIF